MTATVRIDWIREHDNKVMWNEVCAWAIEYFGLPGDRFTTRANVNHMEFIFENEKDALLMALRWNARIISEDELTLRFVGGMLG